MVSRYYRTRLQEAVATADGDSLAGAASNWSANARLLDQVSRSIRRSGLKVKSEIEGNAGEAMVARFNSISDRLDLDADQMRKGSHAIGVAQAAALQATETHHGIMLSGPMNQMPTKPAGPTPGTQPTPEQETAMGNYNAQVNAYLANEERYENQARVALQHMDTEYAAATQVMKEIHGEPDPVDEPRTPITVGGGGTPPSGPVSPPGTPGNPGRQDPQGPRGTTGIEFVEVGGPRDTASAEVRDPRDLSVDTTTPTTLPPQHPTHVSHHVPTQQPITTVGGGTDAGLDYSPGASAGTGGSAPGAPSAPGGVSGAGMAAGGIAGGAAGAAGMRGSAPAAPLRGAGVKGIGATSRPSAPGSLSRSAGIGSTAPRSTTSAGSMPRGATSAGSTPRSTGSPGSAARGATAGGRTAGGATGSSGAAQRGAAGRPGATAAPRSTAKGTAGAAGQGTGKTKGRGLFRRGADGSAAGTRGGRRSDERTGQRDALVYEQDWLGDESAGTGVLD